MPTLCVVLPAADRAQLSQVVANGNTPQKLAVRASILLMLADHLRPSQIATRLALSRNHVYYWTRRYVAAGVGGVLHDAPRPGRRKRITAAQVAAIVDATLKPSHRPRRTGARLLTTEEVCRLTPPAGRGKRRAQSALVWGRAQAT